MPLAALQTWRSLTENAVLRERKLQARRVALRKRYAGQAVVYYVRIHDRVKIGTTANMRERMHILLPDEVLATEPGFRELESLRHAQFAHLRIKGPGERFAPAEDLMSHIRMLNMHFGPAEMTGHLREEPLTAEQEREAADFLLPAPKPDGHIYVTLRTAADLLWLERRRVLGWHLKQRLPNAGQQPGGQREHLFRLDDILAVASQECIRPDTASDHRSWDPIDAEYLDVSA